MTKPVQFRDDEPAPDDAEWLARWTTQPDYSRFSLGVWRREPAEPSGHVMTISPVISLDRETFDRYLEGTVPYTRMTQRHAFRFLQQATRRLEATVQLHSNLHKYTGERHESLDGRKPALDVTKAVTDWLNYSYIYLDPEERFWAHQGQEQLAEFKQATHDAYDTYSAYRFLYQLRHYSQHYGPPLAALDYSAADGAWEMDIMLDKRQLLGGSFEWNAKSRAVLDGLPERFAIVPLITEAMQGYELIEKRLLRMYLWYVESWLDEARAMVEATEGEVGEPCLLAIPPDSSKSMQVLGNVGLQPVMNQRILAQVERSLREPDPIESVWRASQPGRGFIPDGRAALRSTQVMTAFFMGDHGAAWDEIERVIAEDEGDGGPLLSGLVNQLATTLHMLSDLLGSSPEQLLNTDWEELGIDE